MQEAEHRHQESRARESMAGEHRALPDTLPARILRAIGKVSRLLTAQEVGI